MITDVKRIVTGAVDGRPVFTHNESVAPIEPLLYPGATYWLIWGTADGGAVVGGELEPTQKPYFPGPQGSRFVVVRFAPNRAAGAVAAGAGLTADELQRIREDADRALPGLFDVHAADRSGNAAFHVTDTVDYGIVIEGELYVGLPSGEEVRLTPGSCVVQGGVSHAWTNRSEHPALAAYVMLGAARR